MNILRSVGNACRVTEQMDASDVFGNYIATRIRRLSSSVDLEIIKIMEHEITNFIEENRRKFRARSSREAAMYVYNPAESCESDSTTPAPPPQLHSHPEQNITEKPHQPNWH